MVIYFNVNNLFYASQHGFRNGHSCESALHEIIYEMNNLRSKRLIGLYLFIDFKKAFDLVDSRILLAKLKLYGFDKSSIDLIANYFTERQQFVKINGSISDPANLTLGVAQGSCLGPLFFNIFINDLPFFLDKFSTRMFADDTTLSMADKDYDKLLAKFHIEIVQLAVWCKFNKTDINWDKTELMFISKKMAYNDAGKFRLREFPKFINIMGFSVKVVKFFKLLGVIIDNKLNFNLFISVLRKSINKKLYSIKKVILSVFLGQITIFENFYSSLF